MRSYFVSICFDKAVIYHEEVKASSKREAYIKAKAKLAKWLFKPSRLKNYDIQEI